MSNDDEDDTGGEEEVPFVQPFEWLTSPTSLGRLIEEYVLLSPPLSSSSSSSASSTDEGQGSVGRPAVSLQALHIGCGSSTVGEYLVTDLGFGRVVNVDRDMETMRGMETRWMARTTTHHQGRLDFCTLDFTKEPLPTGPHFDGAFDLVLDKSTLDCTLCSDTATASLLVEVYRALSGDRHGVYLVISFHELGLLLPLLRDLPGAHWTVDHTTMERQVEQIGNASVPSSSLSSSVLSYSEHEIPARKPLNVLIARKYPPPSPSAATASSGPSYHDCLPAPSVTESSLPLDFDAVCRHVHQVNDRWYQEQHPLLTEERIQDLKRAFMVEPDDHDDEDLEGPKEEPKRSLARRSLLMTLPHAYNVLFTEAEREHLTLEHFLEDWQAYQQERVSRPSHPDNEINPRLDGNDGVVGQGDDASFSTNHGPIETISYDVALDFLQAMQ